MPWWYSNRKSAEHFPIAQISSRKIIHLIWWCSSADGHLSEFEYIEGLTFVPRSSHFKIITITLRNLFKPFSLGDHDAWTNVVESHYLEHSRANEIPIKHYEQYPRSSSWEIARWTMFQKTAVYRFNAGKIVHHDWMQVIRSWDFSFDMFILRPVNVWASFQDNDWELTTERKV